jgi:hypothetical protein
MNWYKISQSISFEEIVEGLPVVIGDGKWNPNDVYSLPKVGKLTGRTKMQKSRMLVQVKIVYKKWKFDQEKPNHYIRTDEDGIMHQWVPIDQLYKV